jgi:hypothetical protein
MVSFVVPVGVFIKEVSEQWLQVQQLLLCEHLVERVEYPGDGAFGDELSGHYPNPFFGADKA